MSFFSKIFAAFRKRAPSSFPQTAAEARKTWRSAHVIAGEIVNSGAGEFLAKTETLGEIHGTLFGISADEELPAGAQVEIFLRLEILHASDCPPEENFFRAEMLGSDAKSVSESAEDENDDSDAPAFLWAFPEDIVAFPK